MESNEFFKPRYGLILIKEEASNPTVTDVATVIAIGNQVTSVKEGDRILYSRKNAEKISFAAYDYEKYLLINQTDVYGTIHQKKVVEPYEEITGCMSDVKIDAPPSLEIPDFPTPSNDDELFL